MNKGLLVFGRGNKQVGWSVKREHSVGMEEGNHGRATWQRMSAGKILE
jgi:hypothetical protein